MLHLYKRITQVCNRNTNTRNQDASLPWVRFKKKEQIKSNKQPGRKSSDQRKTLAGKVSLTCCSEGIQCIDLQRLLSAIRHNVFQWQWLNAFLFPSQPFLGTIYLVKENSTWENPHQEVAKKLNVKIFGPRCSWIPRGNFFAPFRRIFNCMTIFFLG